MKHFSEKIKPIRSNRSLNQKVTPYIYLAPTVIGMTILMVVPICMVVMYSFMNHAVVAKESSFAGLKNYITILSDPKFRSAIVHTIKFSALSVVFHMLIALTFAMMLNSSIISKRTKAFFRVIYIIPWVFTSTIVATLWRLILNPNGVLNYLIGSQIEWLSSTKLALYTLTFINVWAAYPFFMVTILAGLQGISKDLYEAATVDGANGIQKFIHITIPQLKPILFSMIMLDGIWSTQQFSLVWTITGGGPLNSTDMLGSYTYRLAFMNYKFSPASASAVLILVVVLALAYIYVRYKKVGD